MAEDLVFLTRLVRLGITIPLIATSLYGLWAAYRETQSFRFLFSWNGLVPFTLLGGAIFLMTYDYQQERFFLLLKVLASAFALFYGVFATVNDFYENDNGKRVLTKVGKFGIMFTISTALLSMGTDYINDEVGKNEHLEADRRIEKRREATEKYQRELRDSLYSIKAQQDNTWKKVVTIDSKTKVVSINLKSFSEAVQTDLQKTNDGVNTTNQLISDRLNSTLTDLSNVQAELIQKSLTFSQKEQELKHSQHDLEEKSNQLKTAQETEMALRESLAKANEKLQSTTTLLTDFKSELSQWFAKHDSLTIAKWQPIVSNGFLPKDTTKQVTGSDQ